MDVRGRPLSALRVTLDNCPDAVLRCTGMAQHYHVWVRSGRVFTVGSETFVARSSADAAGRKLRTDRRDRLVLACEDGRCPERRESKRAPRGSLRALTGVQRSTLAARLARELDAAPGPIRAALDAALDGGRPATSSAADTATPDEARAIMPDMAQAVNQ